MSIEIIVNVPADFVVKDEPQTQEEQVLKDTMQRLRVIWTGDPQPGTRVYRNKKLIVAKVNATLQELEDAIASFGYNWTVLGVKDGNEMIRRPKKTTILNFMPDISIIDEEGNITGTERPTEPRLGIYAGSIPWEYE